jgi:hypoxanthine phosphoribosyltransferase
MKLYLHHKDIENRIHELAHEVNDAHYLDDNKFVMVGILNGGFMVFTEFVKHLTIPIECDFVRVKSYTGKKQGKIEITKDIECNIKDKHVFLIDDFADSGKTIQHLIANLDLKGAKTISVVTLFKRKSQPSLILPVDGIHYNGFDVEEEWLVGYGLDDENGYYRNLSNVYSI